MTSLLALLGKLHKIGFDETVNFAIHHSTYVGCLEIGAVVFHTAVVEDIRANL